MTTGVMYDFIFGSLATDEKRLDNVRSELNGISHQYRLEPRDPLPQGPLVVRASTGPAIAADRLTLYLDTNDGIPQGRRGVALVGRAIPMQPVNVEWNTLLWGYVTIWEVILPPQPPNTILRYKIEAWSSLNGLSVFADNQATTSEAATLFAAAVDNQHVPRWAREAIIYHIFVDRFHSGSDRHFQAPASPHDYWGGTLRGITDKLDYLAELGVTALWLSPIFPSPSYHGYDASDYFEIEPRLGSIDDLRRLCDQAHQRGMRIMLDFVAAHVSWEHPYFKAARQDPLSPYRDWFYFGDGPDDYETFFGVRQMPKVNTAHPPARRYLIDAACHWLKQGVDGFRLDFAQGTDRAFWADFRAATRAVHPECFLFGEVIETAELVRSYEGRLDGCLDFLLLQSLRRFFAFRDLPVSTFDAFLRAHERYFPATFLRPTFLDSHDVNRFLWLVKGDVRRLKLAAAAQFSLPGPPIIYYGTEIGMSQSQDVTTPQGNTRDYEARAAMIWDDRQNRGLLAFYRRLIALRRQHPALVFGRHISLVVRDKAGVYAYARDHGTDQVIVVLNNSPKPHRVVVPVSEAEVADGRSLRDLLLLGDAGERGQLVRGGEIVLQMAPYQAVILASNINTSSNKEAV